MNEQAQKILVDLLKKATDGIDSAVAFSQAQIPDVVQQLLMWHAVSSAAIQVLCLLIIIFSITVIVITWNTGDDADSVMLVTVIMGIITIVFLVVFFNYFDWLKIWLAPKLYLIEYAASLVK